MRASAVLLLAIVSSACRGPIDVRLSGPADARYEVLVCRAGGSTCADFAPNMLPADCLYMDVPGEDVRAIGVLDDELHLFVAIARDPEDCEVIGYACEEVEGRTHDAVDLTLATASGTFCGEERVCDGGACVSTERDAGSMDASTDAGVDARVTSDGGTDGGADGGCVDCGPIRDIAAGGAHTCAVTFDGAVYCWGGNEHGQLGMEGTHSEPVRVPNLGGFIAVDVEAGAYHTCARDEPGTVYCWGRNHYGQLGDATAINDIPRRIASEVVGVSDAVELALGFLHTCARRRTGEIRCWGQNESGELGRGDAEVRLQVPSADMAVVEIENAILIAAGDGPSCAVVEGDPELHCWGYNAHGEVGTGTTTPFQYDTPQVVMGSFTDVRDLSAGGYADLGDPGTAHAGHVCVVLGDGGAHCWGRNDQGQLGNDRQDEQSSTPQEVLGTVHALGEIAAGGHHTCAITADGADLYCWGDNEYGQCATTPDEPEDDIDQAARAIVVSTTVGTTLEQVTTGRNHTCVRSRGRVWCWGSNSQGQLGMGAPGGSSHAPTEVVVPDE